MYLSNHDRDDEYAAAEAAYLDKLDEAQEGLCRPRGREHRATIRKLRATIQAKDKQIAALVKGILSIDEWMSGRTCHICPFCKGQYDEHEEDCLRGIAEAIKEATDAS